MLDILIEEGTEWDKILLFKKENEDIKLFKKRVRSLLFIVPFEETGCLTTHMVLHPTLH
jgi:hypothetical protein